MKLNVKINITDADIKKWDYEESIKKMSTIIVPKWKRLSGEILEELYQAKLQLSRVGNPHGKKTWAGFVQEAMGGVTVKTVDNWLRRFEIGEEAWRELQNTRSKTPDPINTESLLIVKREKKGRTYMVHIRVPEYPDITFLESFSL